MAECRAFCQYHLKTDLGKSELIPIRRVTNMEDLVRTLFYWLYRPSVGRSFLSDSEEIYGFSSYFFIIGISINNYIYRIFGTLVT